MEEDSVGKPAAKSTALSIVYSYLNSLSFGNCLCVLSLSLTMSFC